MLLTTRLQLLVDDTLQQPLVGVKVALFDRDESDPDDYLAVGVTDASGEILFQFDSEQYTDIEDTPEWRLESLPDLYVVIYDAAGRAVYSTRTEYLKHALPRRFTVSIPASTAIKHHLAA